MKCASDYTKIQSEILEYTQNYVGIHTRLPQALNILLNFSKLKVESFWKWVMESSFLESKFEILYLEMAFYNNLLTQQDQE